MKKNRKIFIYLAIMMFGFVSAAFFLLKTEHGLRFIFTVAAKIVPGELRAQKIKGCLLGPIDVENFYFKNKSISISADKAHVAWKPKGLLLGKIRITSVHADGLKIHTKSSGDNQGDLVVENIKAGFKKFNSLVNLKLKDVQLNDVMWQQGLNAPIKIETVLLRAYLVGEDIVSLKGELRSQDATILIQGSLQKEWSMSWKIHLPNLKKFLQEADGSVDCEGKVYGKRNNPEIDAIIKVNKFKYSYVSFAKLQSKVELDFSGKKKSRLELNVSSPKINSIGFNQIAFSASVLPIGIKKQAYDFSVDLGATTISFLMGDNSQSVKLEKASMQGALDKQGFSAKGNLLVSQYDPINIEIKLPKAKDFATLFEKQPIDGKISWKTNDMVFLQGFLPGVKGLMGVLDVQYVISGTLQDPQIAGTAKLANASFQIPDLNIKLQNFWLNAKNSQDEVEYQAAMNSDGGNLNLSGKTVFSAEGINSRINIDGNNFLLANTREYSITASPQLVLQTKNDVLTFAGKILIPKGRIRSDYFGYGGLLPSEVVYANKGQDEESKKLNLYAQIKINLGNDVYIDVNGIKGKMEGAIQLNEDPQKVTTATGTLYIKDGSYKIYGQQLKLTKGDLHFFGGAITNPRVSVEATRNFNPSGGSSSLSMSDKGLVVGVRMNGMLDRAKVNLFSIPSGLSKEDILSYLIIGQPRANAAGNQAQLLLQAASALNFGGSGEVTNLVNKLRDKLGFSEFGLTEEIRSNKSQDIGSVIQQGPGENVGDSLTTNTAFSMGKFLTPKLYVGYSMGFVDLVNIFRVRYYMGKNWAVQSESSSLGEGVDLLYTFESK
ncbi:MAG: translocation/assembly module TamB domain-containing protein [Gammaproteobacteria bacterium]|nr:translocation/assembly module TamB domain-containing protein [Gammaproteobacteria bacterium]